MPDAFEARYLGRAAEALDASDVRGSIERIALDQGRETSSGEAVLVGWWAPPWTGPPAVVLPNPWEDREAIAVYDEEAWRLTRTLVAKLGPLMNELHRHDHPPEYWQLFLSEWVLQITSVILDRRIFCLTASRLAPEARFGPAQAQSVPGTTLEAAVTYQHEAGNAAVMTAICRALGLPLSEPPVPSDPLPAKGLQRRGSRLKRLASDPRGTARLAVGLAAHRLIARKPSAEVTLLALSGLTPLDVLRLRRASGLQLSLAPMSATEIPSASGLREEARARLGVLPAGCDRERLIVRLLGELMPRTLLEDYSAVASESERRHRAAGHVVVGNSLVNEIDNEYIARSAAAGRGIAFAQHGGSYQQLRVHWSQRLESWPGREFLSWGARGLGVEPCPTPRLQRLRDSHRGGDAAVLVEWFDPPIPYAVGFSTIPMANQGYEVAELLARFAAAVRRGRESLVLKSFPTYVEEGTRHPVLEALASRRTRLRGSAVEWMERARIAVVDYPDTPFIEAMLIGVPTIGLWDPGMWEVSDEAAPYFDRLVELGVVHHDPEQAAAQFDRVWVDPGGWWSAPDVQEARRGFLERFAGGSGDWKRAWSEQLRRLARS